jgi:phosphoglycerate dehydrogenase-like enzyme
MSAVLRWGQSAYETDADLALEEAAARALGLGWRVVPETVPARELPLEGVGALVVTSRVRVDAQALARFQGSLLLTTTSGWEHLDVETARAQGVAVARCPLARRDAVAESAVGAMVALLRRQPAFDEAARRGRWARAELPGLDPLLLSDSAVLIVGLGVIGARVAELLRPFGARLWGVDPRGVPEGVERVELEAALASADVITLHCALNPTTEGLISGARLQSMRPGSVLVNTARGRLLDVDAAVDAVRGGRLRGLAVDVFPQEPWPGLQAAAQLDGIWLTPHSAGYTRGLGTRVAREVADALRAWVSSEPVPHEVFEEG